MTMRTANSNVVYSTASEGGTIAAPVLISASSSGNAFEVRQLGAGNAFVVEDSANPDATPFVINASGNVGVGTGSPASLLNVDGGTITSQRYAQAGNITLRRANGTASSPSAVLAGEQTGSVVNRAYDGVSTYRDIGGMYFYANQNVSASQSGGGIIFNITPDGSTTMTERMRIDSSGNVGIGTSSPSFRLDVRRDGSSSVANFQNTDTTNTYNTDIYVNNANVAGNLLLTRRANGEFWIYQSGNHSISLTPNATERFKIDGAGLITGTGTSLGAWTAYTPTLGGTGWAIGNGTATGVYCQIGKIVHVLAGIAFGSTSTFGAGIPTITLPVTAAVRDIHITGELIDTSLSAIYLALWRYNTTTTLNGRYASGGASSAISATNPFTWATTDTMRFQGTYEIA